MARINLLPAEIQTRQRSRRILTFVTAAGVIVLVLLSLVYLFQLGRISNEEEELAALEAERGRIAAEVAALAEFGQLQASINQKRSTLSTSLMGDVAWSKLLNDISLIMPDNSWIVNLSLQSAAAEAATGQATIGTTTFQGFVFDFPGLAGWLTRMNQIEGLVNVYLSTGARQDLAGRTVVSFGASAGITEPLLSQRCQEGQPCP